MASSPFIYKSLLSCFFQSKLSQFVLAMKSNGKAIVSDDPIVKKPSGSLINWWNEVRDTCIIRVKSQAYLLELFLIDYLTLASIISYVSICRILWEKNCVCVLRLEKPTSPGKFLKDLLLLYDLKSIHCIHRDLREVSIPQRSIICGWCEGLRSRSGETHRCFPQC